MCNLGRRGELRELKWLEKAHKKTGKPIEELKQMSWSDVEKLLGIEIEEPPKELKYLIKGGYFAKRKRWVTQKELERMRREADILVRKYASKKRK